MSRILTTSQHKSWPRTFGFDGILYKSLLDKNGRNIALFDPTLAKLTICCLYRFNAASLGCAKLEYGYSTTCPDSLSSELEEVEL